SSASTETPWPACWPVPVAASTAIQITPATAILRVNDGTLIPDLQIKLTGIILTWGAEVRGCGVRWCVRGAGCEVRGACEGARCDGTGSDGPTVRTVLT